MTNIINGIEVRDYYFNKYKDEIFRNHYKMKLVIIYIGNDQASRIYVNKKKEICDKLNISCEILHYESILEYELLKIIDGLNNDFSVTGIMVELPLPNNIDKEKVINSIDPLKDVDGLTMDSLVIPCTALAIINILKYYDVSINDSSIAIVGYSNLIGKPLEKYFISCGIKPFICNSKTNDLKNILLNSDIIITGVGKYNLIKEEMINEGSILIDAGIVRHNNRVVGDCDFNNVKDKCLLMTPVPGGVGPVTTIMVVNNLIDLYKRKFL